MGRRLPVYFIILKLSDIISGHVRSFISVRNDIKLTHYDDLDLEFVKIEHKSFSEIISNQTFSPALDKKERQG